MSIRWRTSRAHATSRVTVRAIGSTPPLRHAAKPESEPPLKLLDDDDDVDDGPECPPWQNPLHHNNPDYQIPVFKEDYAPGEEMPTVPLPPFEPEEEGKSVIAPPHVHALAEEIVQLNMLEVKELVDRIGEHFGFDDEDSYPAEGEGGGEEAKEEEVVEERTAFDLKLTGFEAKGKIKVIKEVRAMAGLGLKEAKEMVEGAPVSHGGRWGNDRAGPANRGTTTLRSLVRSFLATQKSRTSFGPTWLHLHAPFPGQRAQGGQGGIKRTLDRSPCRARQLDNAAGTLALSFCKNV